MPRVIGMDVHRDFAQVVALENERLQDYLNAEDWGSFPSDHGAMWFALVYGLWRLSRPVGIAAAVFSTVWVCVVRIYLGIHYPSDVIAGGLIGLACAYVTPRLGGDRLATFALKYEKTYPQAFYAVAFLVTFEIAEIFDDVRVFMRGSLRALQALGFKSVHLMEALVLGGAVVLLFALTILALVKCWRQSQRFRSRSRRTPDLCLTGFGGVCERVRAPGEVKERTV